MKERNKNDDSTTVTIPIRELLKLPIETVPNECLDIEHTTLFRDAINEFIDSKVIMSRRELMNKNVIKIDKIDDLSRFVDLDRNVIEDEEFANYKNNESIYTSIPCFQEGVYYIKESEQYYHWVIKNLTLTESGYMMDVRVTMYLRQLDVCDGMMLWIPIGSIRYETDGTNFRSVNTTNDLETADYSLNALMKAIFLCSDRKRSKKEKEMLSEIASYYQNELFPDTYEVNKRNWENDEYIAKQFEEDVSIEISGGFYHLTRFTNYTIFTNKPVVDRARAATKSGPKVKTSVIKNEQPAKIVRNIGKIRVISSKAPKLPTAESIRKYKVASWPTRGFIRTYKSGKQVYVRDSVHHRKCFNDDKIPTPTVYVNLRSSNVVS